MGPPQSKTKGYTPIDTNLSECPNEELKPYFELTKQYLDKLEDVRFCFNKSKIAMNYLSGVNQLLEINNTVKDACLCWLYCLSWDNLNKNETFFDEKNIENSSDENKDFLKYYNIAKSIANNLENIKKINKEVEKKIDEYDKIKEEYRQKNAIKTIQEIKVIICPIVLFKRSEKQKELLFKEMASFCKEDNELKNNEKQIIEKLKKQYKNAKCKTMKESFDLIFKDKKKMKRIPIEENCIEDLNKLYEVLNRLHFEKC